MILGDQVPEFTAFVLPSVKELLGAEELHDLSQSPTFEYLVNAGFEHLQRMKVLKRNPQSYVDAEMEETM